MDKLNFDINQFLRFLLAGGWGLICFLFLNPSATESILSDSGIYLIITALIIGSILYVLHRSVIYPFLYKLICLILWILKKRKWDWGILWLVFPSKTEIAEDLHRWEQRKNENSASSKHITDWGSQVHFLYCSALASQSAIILSEQLGDFVCDRLIYVQVLFWILFISGFINHIRVVLYDLSINNIN